MDKQARLFDAGGDVSRASQQNLPAWLRLKANLNVEKEHLDRSGSTIERGKTDPERGDAMDRGQEAMRGLDALRGKEDPERGQDALRGQEQDQDEELNRQGVEGEKGYPVNALVPNWLKLKKNLKIARK